MAQQGAPHGREKQLLIEEAGDELLVYDQRSDHAHRLNATAALVFKNCDGERTIPDLVAILSEKLGDVADEDLVRITLDDLAKADLLQDAQLRSADDSRTSRRRFIRRVGTVGAAALALPVVHSIVAPTAAEAASCQEDYFYHGQCYSYTAVSEQRKQQWEDEARKALGK
jgi:hypothetical protein